MRLTGGLTNRATWVQCSLRVDPWLLEGLREERYRLCVEIGRLALGNRWRRWGVRSVGRHKEGRRMAVYRVEGCRSDRRRIIVGARIEGTIGGGAVRSVRKRVVGHIADQTRILVLPSTLMRGHVESRRKESVLVVLGTEGTPRRCLLTGLGTLILLVFRFTRFPRLLRNVLHR